MKQYLLLTLAFLLIISACNSTKIGHKKFEAGEYDVAISYFENSLEKNASSASTNFYIAEAYRLSNRMDQAQPYYRAAIENGVTSEEAELYYGLSLKVNGDYEAARAQLEKYLDQGTNFDYLNLAKTELKNLEVLSKLKAKETWYKVSNFEILNTEAGEYSPIVNNGELFFTSSRGDGKIYKTTGTSFTDIYKAKLVGKDNVANSSISPLGYEINAPGVNEGTVTFTRKGQVMVFAKGNSGKRKGTKEVNLYISRLKNDKWSEPKILTISDPNAWDSSPAFSNNGRTLYFASNREGGQGGVDLYSAKMDGNGRWGQVQNMGPDINTPGDEMFPYVSDDGKLYFSSSGHPGFGGLDLFVAEKVDGKISIENLGKPVNSSKDDFGITFLDPAHGFFSSNRDGGKGDDDIYIFEDNSPNIKIVHYVLKGTTTTTSDEGARVALPYTKIRFQYSNGDLITQTMSDADGKFKFKVEGGRDYTIVGEKQDHFTTRVDFSTVGRSVDKSKLKQLETTVTFETSVNLDKIVVNKAIVLDNIYYDFDKAEIREDAALELDKLVNLLKDNRNIKIELSSHTDSRGNDEYNEELSQRRAESAVNYIIAEGISADRITAKGYGESKPIVPNADTEEEHEMNRRTEFKVTDLIPQKKPTLDEGPEPDGTEEEE